MTPWKGYSMASDKQIENLFFKIAKNKSKVQPYSEALANHNRLVDKLNKTLGERRDYLENLAFRELQPEPVNDPMQAVITAIKENDTEAIKQAGVNAYKSGFYTAFRIAAEFNHDLMSLAEFLETFGELASTNQRVFIRAALEAPIRERATP